MKVKIDKLRDLLISILVHYKISKSEAEIIADEHLEGELQGKRSHGLMAFPSLIKKLPFKSGKVVIKKKTSSFIFVDANKNFGAVVGKQFADQAISMAKKQGVAMVSIRNMITWLRPATIAQQIAKQKMIGLVVNSGGNSMIAPPGGFTPVIGTNPIGIGIPSDGNDIVIDMATSKRAWGEVRKAISDKTNLPADTYFDSKGNFTLDPLKAISVIASGDYKGFSLALLIEILTGSFIDMPMSQDKVKKMDYRTLPRGGVILVFNPRFSTSLNKFKKENKKLAEKIRHSKKRKGSRVILVPGDRAMSKKNSYIRSGNIDVQENLWNVLISLLD